MLHSLSIKNFRGIPSLSLDDLARVNILIGHNGSGKTTVLEAAALAANPTYPGQLPNLAYWRDIPGPSLDNDDALRTFFMDTDLSRPPLLEVVDQNGVHALTVEAITKRSEAHRVDVSSDHPGVEDWVPNGGAQDLIGVKYLYRSPDSPELHEGRINLTRNGYEVFPYPGDTSLRPATFVRARQATSPQETANAVTELYASKTHASFLHVLQIIEPRVAHIQGGVRGNTPVVLVDIGLRRMVPINTLGDGFCRVCLIATGLVLYNARTVLVDEIDSGLHRSVMQSSWEGFHHLAVEFDSQIICATHSEEMLYHAIAAFKDAPDDLRVYRIDRDDAGNVTAQKFTYDMLAEAEKAGLDIR